MDLDKILNKKRESFVRENLMSDSFIDFVEQNQAPYETLMSYYRCALMEIETKFRVLDQEFSLHYDRNPIESIKSRIKSWDSLIRKIRDKNIPLDLDSIEENISDIAGIRIICSFQEDIYMLAECLLRQTDIKLIEKKDYIANPKPNGYRSLHLIVEVPIFLQKEVRPMKVEVQLRTIAMDFWASLEHKLRYKKTIPADQAESISADLKECAEISAELDKRMQDVRHRIMTESEEIEHEAKHRIPIKERINMIEKRRN